MKKLSMLIMFALLLSLSPVSATHNDGQCQLTNINPHDILQFLIIGESQSIPLPSTVIEGNTVNGRLWLEFDDDIVNEDITVEVGMYRTGTPQVLANVQMAYDLSANPTLNCVAGEKNVDTFHINSFTRDDNGLLVASFDLVAPVDADLNDGGTENYVIQAVIFKNCYKACASETGSLSLKWTSVPIKLQDNPSLSGNVDSDGVKNGGETDLDCGGTSSNKCDIGYRCNIVSDCVGEANVCTSLGDGLAKVCTIQGGEEFENNNTLRLILLGVIGVGGFMYFRKKNNKR